MLGLRAQPTARSGPAPSNHKVGIMDRSKTRTGLMVLAVVTAGWVFGSASTALADSDDKGPVEIRPVTLFTNFNSGAVNNQARSATTFSLKAPRVITTVQTYHWNNGRGKAPGTIKLVSAGGQSFGSWQARGGDGQGGVKNAFWTVNPGVLLPTGTYTIVDSEPATWSNNVQSAYRGFALVMGR
jgi:hypothetical protein